MIARLESALNVNAWRRVLAVYWLAMFVGTHWPRFRPPVETPIVPADKLLHVAGYAGLTVLLGLARVFGRARPVGGWSTAWRCAVAALVYGIVDELTQTLPGIGRKATAVDWFADAVGAAVGVGLLVWVGARATRGSCCVTENEATG